MDPYFFHLLRFFGIKCEIQRRRIKNLDYFRFFSNSMKKSISVISSSFIIQNENLLKEEDKIINKKKNTNLPTNNETLYHKKVK